jgi:hypothetical protein
MLGWMDEVREALGSPARYRFAGTVDARATPGATFDEATYRAEMATLKDQLAACPRRSIATWSPSTAQH